MLDKNRRKGWRFYVQAFISGVAGVLILGVLSAVWQWPLDSFNETIEGFWYIPIYVVLIVFFFQKSKEIFGAKTRARNEAHDFLMHMSKKVRKDLGYEKEEFQELQEDERFQTFFEDLYRLYMEGERADLSFNDMERRFDEDDFPYEAAQLLIKETKRVREAYKED